MDQRAKFCYKLFRVGQQRTTNNVHGWTMTAWGRMGSVLLLQACLAGAAGAATIQYSATNLGGSSWEYSYLVSNDTLGAPLEEFTVFFEVGLYQNLALTGSPADWDSVVVQPDDQLPDDGYLDSLAQVAGIAVSGSLGGFSVSFDFLGQGTPAAQPFDIVDPDTFAVLESGTTTVVPAPAGLWLAMTGVGMIAARARKRSAS
jgi:hypothetical protein